MNDTVFETLWRAYQNDLIEGFPTLKRNTDTDALDEKQEQFENLHKLDIDAKNELFDITIP